MIKKLLKGLGIGFGVFVALVALIMFVGSDENYQDKLDEAAVNKVEATETVEETETEEIATEEPVAEVETEVVEETIAEDNTDDQPWLQDSGDYGEDVDYAEPSSTSGPCDYIASLDSSNSSLYQVTNTGNYTVDNIYEMVNYQIETGHYGTNDYSDSFVRDLNSIGMPVSFSGNVSVVHNSSDGSYITVYNLNDLTTELIIDLSYIGSDMAIFEHDNIDLTGIYLGLSSDNKPVLLATEINVY